MTQNLKAMADAAARRYGVPPSLFRKLIKQESGWNPDARNPSGATGLVQIHLPSHPTISEEQARDPAFALGWGARYLATQKKRFGRWDLALAAYNAGPGNVESGRWKSFPETRNYVKNIIGGGVGGKAPVALPAPATAASGLPVAPAPPLAQPPVQGPVISPTVTGILDRNAALIGVPSIAPLLARLAPTPTPELAVPTAAPAAASAPAPQEPFKPAPVKGFVPAFETALNRLLKDTGLTVVSGYRSPERQAALYAAAVKKYGSEQAARKWVAPPGKSQHNHGVAADLGGDLSILSDSLLKKYGLYRPMSYEPWHVELIGSRG